jgi:hypothetical protein
LPKIATKRSHTTRAAMSTIPLHRPVTAMHNLLKHFAKTTHISTMLYKCIIL